MQQSTPPHVLPGALAAMGGEARKQSSRPRRSGVRGHWLTEDESVHTDASAEVDVNVGPDVAVDAVADSNDDAASTASTTENVGDAVDASNVAGDVDATAAHASRQHVGRNAGGQHHSAPSFEGDSGDRIVGVAPPQRIPSPTAAHAHDKAPYLWMGGLVAVGASSWITGTELHQKPVTPPVGLPDETNNTSTDTSSMAPLMGGQSATTVPEGGINAGGMGGTKQTGAVTTEPESPSTTAVEGEPGGQPAENETHGGTIDGGKTGGEATDGGKTGGRATDGGTIDRGATDGGTTGERATDGGTIGGGATDGGPGPATEAGATTVTESSGSKPGETDKRGESAGNGAGAEQEVDTTPPAAPTLSWQVLRRPGAPADEDARHVRVILSGLEPGQRWLASIDGGPWSPGEGSSLMDRSLETPGVHQVRVKVLDAANNESAVAEVDVALAVPLQICSTEEVRCADGMDAPLHTNARTLRVEGLPPGDQMQEFRFAGIDREWKAMEHGWLPLPETDGTYDIEVRTVQRGVETGRGAAQWVVDRTAPESPKVEFQPQRWSFEEERAIPAKLTVTGETGNRLVYSTGGLNEWRPIDDNVLDVSDISEPGQILVAQFDQAGNRSEALLTFVDFVPPRSSFILTHVNHIAGESPFITLAVSSDKEIVDTRWSVGDGDWKRQSKNRIEVEKWRTPGPLHLRSIAVDEVGNEAELNLQRTYVPHDIEIALRVDSGLTASQRADLITNSADLVVKRWPSGGLTWELEANNRKLKEGTGENIQLDDLEDGTYDLRLQAVHWGADEFGIYAGGASLKITLDRTPPAAPMFVWSDDASGHRLEGLEPGGTLYINDVIIDAAEYGDGVLPRAERWAKNGKLRVLHYDIAGNASEEATHPIEPRAVDPVVTPTKVNPQPERTNPPSTVDSEPPGAPKLTWEVESVNDGATPSGEKTIKIHLDGLEPNQRWKASIDGGPWEDGQGRIWVDDRLDRPGVHEVAVKALDAAGNESESTTVKVARPVTLDVCIDEQLCDGSNGELYAAKNVFAIKGAPPGADRYETSAAGAGGGSVENRVTLSDGTHELIVRSWQGGLLTGEGHRTIHVDTVAPTPPEIIAAAKVAGSDLILLNKQYQQKPWEQLSFKTEPGTAVEVRDTSPGAPWRQWLPGEALPLQVSEGPRSFLSRAIDKAGNATERFIDLHADFTPPRAPKTKSAPQVSMDALTISASVQVTPEPGSFVRFRTASDQAWKAIPKWGGLFLLLAEDVGASKEILISQVDGAGNESPEVVLSNVDLVRPAVPRLTRVFPQLKEDGSAEPTALEIHGLESTQRWRVRINGGDWREGTGAILTDPQLTAGQIHKVEIQQLDGAGNQSQILTKNIHAPFPLRLELEMDSGMTNHQRSDRITNIPQVNIIGLPDADVRGKAFINGETVFLGKDRSIDAKHFKEDGEYQLAYELLSGDARTELGRAEFAFTLDRVAPEQPELELSIDSGELQLSNIEPGAFLYLNGELIQPSEYADGVLHHATLFAKDGRLTVQVVDQAGNASKSFTNELDEDDYHRVLGWQTDQTMVESQPSSIGLPT